MAYQYTSSDMRGSFLLGVLFAAIVSLLIAVGFMTDTSVRKEGALSKQCQPGEKGVMTSAAVSEYYECEAHWVRK